MGFRVLIFSHPEMDYGAAFLYEGLCQLLGTQNVVTYPCKNTYYGEVDQGYLLDDGKLGYTAPCEWQVARSPKINWGEDEIVKRLKDGYFNLCIIESPRTHAINVARKIKDKAGKLLNLVLADHEDYDGFKWDIFNEFQPDLVFKRELFADSALYRQLKGRVFPLPFSAYLNDKALCGDKEKDIDIFCATGNTHPARQRLINTLKSVPGVKFVGGGNEYRLNYKEYHEHIARSWICPSPCGWGTDCVRHWEVNFHKTVMLLENSRQIVPNPFEHEKHCLRYTSDLADLGPVLNKYLNDKNACAQLALAGYNYLRRYHTTEKRAEYFLETCRDKLGTKWR